MPNFVQEYRVGLKRNVWVRPESAGQDRWRTLCVACEMEDTCEALKELTRANKRFGTVTPVYECPSFSENVEW
jgi:hypothetical protein